MRSLFRTRTPATPPTEPVPTVFPKVEGAELAAAFSGKRIAGDLYDCVRASPERILLGLLDVAGRREDNRGVVTSAQDIFRNVGADLFNRPDINESEAMTELSLRLNRGIMEVAGGVRACPAFIACYHEKFGTLCYTNAGHTPGLLRDTTGIIELAPTGLPLGLFSHATSDAPTVGLAKGAALLLVSRGVVEGKCKGDKTDDLEFGLERVKERLRDTPSDTAQALCTAILNAVGEFTCVPIGNDDRTALVFKRTG
jgi:phosphoserine phosphatase RsbU/P